MLLRKKFQVYIFLWAGNKPNNGKKIIDFPKNPAKSTKTNLREN